MSNLSDTDVYAWADERAKLLRAGELAADVAHVAAALETVGEPRSASSSAGSPCS